MQPLIGPQLVRNTLKCARYMYQHDPCAWASGFIYRNNVDSARESSTIVEPAHTISYEGASRAEFRKCIRSVAGAATGGQREAIHSNGYRRERDFRATFTDLRGNRFWWRETQMEDFGVYAVFGVKCPPQRLLRYVNHY